MSNKELPTQTHKGNNHLRIISIFILLAVIVFSAILLILTKTQLFIGTIICSFVGLTFIKFPFLHLYNHKFTVERKGIFKLFSEKNDYNYNEVDKVWFSKGFTIRVNIIALILSGGDTTGSSKADQMVIKIKDGKKEVINRFGRKSDFTQIIKQINDRCSNTEELY